MNILDYVRWRNDVPFSLAPFNDVDNVILAELAYTEFTTYVPRDHHFISLQEVHDTFFQYHSYRDIEQHAVFIDRAPLLMRDMIHGARFQNIRLGHYINAIDKDKEMQLSATVFQLDDDTHYIAFRGTDSTIVGWKEDFKMSYSGEIEGAKAAVRYLNRVGAQIPGNLRIGGHSKGGNFAVYAASFCDPAIQNRILKVYSNDGPGFPENVIASPGYQAILPKITSIIPDMAIIGLLLSNACPHRIVRSTASGILQHDAFSWEVCKDGIVETTLSEESRFIQTVLGHWLEKVDEDARASLIDTIFSLIESTGSVTFKELGRQKLKTAEIMIAGLYHLPKDKQRELIRALRDLFFSGGSAAKNYWPPVNRFKA